MVSNKRINEKRNSTEWQEYQRLMRERGALFLPSDALTIVTDPEKICEFEEKTGRKIGVVYKSPYSMLVVDCVHTGGELFCYERLVPTSVGTAVVGVPVYNGKYVLLKQFRHSLRGYQYAFPRGYGEDGISAEDNVRKEISEELGAEIKQYKKIGEVISDSGRSGEKVSVFLCDITAPELRNGYEGIEGLLPLSEEELKQYIADGRINDGYTLSAYALLAALPKKIF